MICKLKTSTLFILFAALINHAAEAQEIKVKARLDSMVMEIGDQTWLNLIVEQNDEQIVIFPEIKDTIISGVDVVRIAEIDTVKSNSCIVATQRILITAFEDSMYQIPPFPFKHGNDTLYSNSIVLSVSDIKLDSAELALIDTTQVMKVYDVKDPINTPLTFKEFISRFYWLIILVIFAVAAFILIRIYLKRRAKNKPFIKLPEKPKEPAHIIAFRELDSLKQEKLWQSGKEKAYYSRLTDILRDYLDNRYNISTHELTSNELIQSIKTRKILEGELLESLRQVFSIADLAKFAKFKPLPSENDLCFKNTYELVEKTKLVKVQSTAPSFENVNNEETEVKSTKE